MLHTEDWFDRFWAAMPDQRRELVFLKKRWAEANTKFQKQKLNTTTYCRNVHNQLPHRKPLRPSCPW